METAKKKEEKVKVLDRDDWILKKRLDEMDKEQVIHFYKKKVNYLWGVILFVEILLIVFAVAFVYHLNDLSSVETKKLYAVSNKLCHAAKAGNVEFVYTNSITETVAVQCTDGIIYAPNILKKR